MVKGFKVKNSGPVLYPHKNSEVFCVTNPSVIFDGEVYHMWFIDYIDCKSIVGHAVSKDGKVWEDRTHIDGLDEYIRTITVIKTDNKFYMWLVTNHGYPNDVSLVYMATSTDGVNWSISGRTNCHEAIYRSVSMVPRSMSVVKVGKIFYMWYSVNFYDLKESHLLTSEDGITWTKNERVYEHPFKSIIIKDKEHFLMFYISIIDDKETISVKTSIDGIKWKLCHNIDLHLDKKDGVVKTFSPTVVKDNEGYKIWYSTRHYHGDWKIYYTDTPN